ncbi:hypothetical protein TRICI_002381 [Trichomonascus ciferrii]|uniref:DEK C-terminal domain-containing protein n=1 Tax=Trichomonascus ciferrii TaxID=44093 RepID=A0A642V609_9ASCO|nr:hypothetical protein TRICI_002381 [Trichomonascus ciferrii]
MVEEDEIERTLVEEVKKADLDLATTNSIRKKVEEKLELGAGFLKSNDWKERSKELINRTLEECTQAQDHGEQGGSENDDGEEQDDGEEEEAEDGREEEKEDESGKENESGWNSEKEEGEKNEESIEEDRKEEAKKEADSIEKDGKGEAKKGKKRKPPASSTGDKKVTKAPRKVSTKSTKDRSSEILKLKGQLLKCGIRKQWNKILDPLPTDAARVNYLKEQLAEAGITGRFSLKKAEQVKEKRELEELQREAATYLGGSGSEEPENRPTRRKRVVVDEDDDDD